MNFSFANPTFLFLLIALLPVLFSYLRSRRGKVHATPFLELWNQASSKASWWEKLLVRIPEHRILFAVLSVVLLSLAAAGLRWKRPGGSVRHIILDRSGSMAAAGENEMTRWDLARDEALRAISAMRPSDRLSLSVWDEEIQILHLPTESRTALSSVLEAAGPRPRATDFKNFSGAMEGLEGESLLFTDGQGVTAESEPWFSNVSVFGVGSEAANWGIVSFEAADTWPRSTFPLRVRVKNFSSEPGEKEVRVGWENGEVETVSVSLDPQGVWEQTWQIDRSEGGIFKVRLVEDDAYSWDNLAGAWIRPPPKMPIVLLARNGAVNPFLRAAAEVLREDEQGEFLTVERTDQIPVPSVVLAEGGEWEFPEGLEGRFLLFGSRWEPAVVEPSREMPSVLDWDREHFLTKRFNFDLFSCREALTVGSEVRPLVWSSDGPLLYCAERGKTRIVGTAFTLDQSNFPLQAAFPLFVRRAYAWLQEMEARVPASVGAGERFAREEAGKSWEAPWAIGYWESPDGPTYVNFLNEGESSLGTSFPSGWNNTRETGSRRWADLTVDLLYLALGCLGMLALLDFMNRFNL